MDNNTYEIYEVQYKGITIYIGSGKTGRHLCQNL